jgi:hypothetical protein
MVLTMIIPVTARLLAASSSSTIKKSKPTFKIKRLFGSGSGKLQSGSGSNIQRQLDIEARIKAEKALRLYRV